MDFSTDELLAVSGADEPAPYAALEAALATAVVEPAEAGYRFRHALVRESVLSGFTLHRGPARDARSPSGSRTWTRPRPGWPGPVRRPGHPVRALPYARAAIETAGARGLPGRLRCSTPSWTMPTGSSGVTCSPGVATC